MPKFFASDPHCTGVSTERRRYNANKQGFIQVDDHRDAKALKAGGYVQAGNVPKTSRRWVCECGWQAIINHCPKCDRDDLERHP